jgi:hypothetical protein
MRLQDVNHVIPRIRIGSAKIKMALLATYHIYQNDWIPRKGETLFVKHEDKNHYDRYAIAALKQEHGGLREKIVGHLPKEISRLVRFIMLHRARVSLKVIEEDY